MYPKLVFFFNLKQGGEELWKTLPHQRLLCYIPCVIYKRITCKMLSLDSRVQTIRFPYLKVPTYMHIQEWPVKLKQPCVQVFVIGRKQELSKMKKLHMNSRIFLNPLFSFFCFGKKNNKHNLFIYWGSTINSAIYTYVRGLGTAPTGHAPIERLLSLKMAKLLGSVIFSFFTDG